MFVVETILFSQFTWVSVFSSSNLSIKLAYTNFPKLSTVRCVSRYVQIRAIIYSTPVYWNLPIWWILKTRVSILLSSRCWWWARLLRWILFDASKYSFQILVFCSHTLSILMTEPTHRRGTLDYLLIWTCGDTILFSHSQIRLKVNVNYLRVLMWTICCSMWYGFR